MAPEVCGPKLCGFLLGFLAQLGAPESQEPFQWGERPLNLSVALERELTFLSQSYLQSSEATGWCQV